MRILHVLDHSLPETSGYSLRSHNIIQEQRRLGWSTFQVTGPRHAAAANAVETIDGLEFFRTASRLPKWAARTPFDFVSTVRDLRLRLRAIISQVKPDVIHAHSPCSVGLAALGLGRPVVYEMRTLWEEGSILAGRLAENSFLHRAVRALETHVLRRADAVVSISEGLRAEVIARGISADKVDVIRNAVNSENLSRQHFGDPSSARRGFALSSAYVLGYIGSLFAWEGIQLLLLALAQLRAQGLDIGLLIVGTGPDERMLQQSSKDLGVADYVVFTGRIAHDAAVRAYDAIDLLVYPRLPMRLTEMVTPLKPLEAMALGKAIVASDVGGHRELIEDGSTGVLFRAGDSGALAAAILRVMEDRELAQRLCADGRTYVREKRTWTAVVRGYEPVYRRVLRSGT